MDADSKYSFTACKLRFFVRIRLASHPLITFFSRLLTFGNTTLYVSICGVIKSFKSKDAEKIYQGRYIKRIPPEITRLAARKLELLDAASELTFPHFK